MSLPHVIVLGGGFAGLWAAQALRKSPVEVTIVDRTNHHLFTPLLYQVATAGLSAPAIAAPIRHILAAQRNTTVLLGEAQKIDVNEKKVPLEDALEIRARILTAFERAERESDPARRAAWLTFVVVGAGATGVELAGTLAEIARHTLRGEFRHFDPRNARVVLVEGTDRVLPLYPPELSEKARLQLERLGVTVWLGRRVTEVDAGGVTLGNDRIGAKTVIWAAGVASSPLA